MPVPTHQYAPWYPPTLASDSDRERTVEILRGHWLEGRLTLDDLEARSREALGARHVGDLWSAVRELPVGAAPAARPAGGDQRQGAAIASVVLSSLGLILFLISFSLLALLTLPLSASGWIAGRSARRGTGTAQRSSGTALAGEVLGIVGTIGACMALAACAALVA